MWNRLCSSKLRRCNGDNVVRDGAFRTAQRSVISEIMTAWKNNGESRETDKGPPSFTLNSLSPWLLLRERTIPAERPPLVDEI
jgi:hypothetical protein